MTLKQLILEFLQKVPIGRERKNRANVVWYLFHKHLDLPHDKDISKEVFLKHFKDLQSINRLILWHQQHNKDLRGSDYYDKEKLEQETKINLGYQPNNSYYQEKLKK